MLRKTLNNGIEMPTLGHGVFQTPPEETERCMAETFDIGYRPIDTAQAYDSEGGAGATVRASDVPREEIFTTSKIWVADMNYERVAASTGEPLHRLDTDYIGLMLLHQAMGDYPGAYRAMEDTYKAGKPYATGVLGFYPEHLIDIALLAEVPPAISQIEIHPSRQQDAAHEVMTEFGVAHKAWASFVEGQSSVFTNPVFTEIGEKHGKKPGQVIPRVPMQKDVIVVPKTTHRSRTEEDLDVFDFEPYTEDLAAFAALDDGSLPRTFGHYDPKMVMRMFRDYVRNNQLGGGALYRKRHFVHAICANA